MGPWDIEWAGRLDEVWIDSVQLRDNSLHDPARRPVWIYLPPTYDDRADWRYPAIYVLQGYTGQVDMWRNRNPFRHTFPEAVDELFARGQAPPCIVVFVDCWTSLGGSQYLDSPATGRYHSYLCDDVVPWVDARYRTLPGSSHRGVMGHSSGGYGAMVTSMLRPDLFGGFASHAGDALFEYCYLPDFARAARELRDRYHGSYERFWADLRGREFRPDDFTLVAPYAMAACYSAGEDGTVHLPFDIQTGRLRPEVWERWLARDPVRMVPRHGAALRSMRAIYLDAGTRDEHFLDVAAGAVCRELEQVGVTGVRFELHEGGHSGNHHRYPLSLRFLAERLD